MNIIFMHHLKEWFDVCAVRGRSEEVSDPFKSNRPPSELRSLATMQDDPRYIKPDPVHTYNIGWGKDLAGSSILLIYHMGLLPGRSVQSVLDNAFALFKAYVHRRKLATSVVNFSLKTLKIETILGYI